LQIEEMTAYVISCFVANIALIGLVPRGWETPLSVSEWHSNEPKKRGCLSDQLQVQGIEMTPPNMH
jgi:hypothetical protein